MTRPARDGDGAGPAAAADGARGLAFFVALLLLYVAVRLAARGVAGP